MAGNQVLGEVCIKRGIFRGDSLSPLLIVLALILLKLALRNVKAGYSLGNGLPTLIHLLFMDDLKLYGKSENQVDVRQDNSLGNGLPTLVHLLFMDDLKLCGKREKQVDIQLRQDIVWGMDFLH